jgi:hypothetical protein
MPVVLLVPAMTTDNVSTGNLETLKEHYMGAIVTLKVSDA